MRTNTCNISIFYDSFCNMTCKFINRMAVHVTWDKVVLGKFMQWELNYL